MGRRGKYDEWRIKRIVQAIRRTGMDQAGIAAGDISEATFYRWQKEKEEFQERVARAKRKFADINDHEIAITFRRQLIKAMKGASEKWSSKETTHLPSGETVVEESAKKIKRTPAKWAFEIAAPQVGGRFGVEQQELSGKEGGAVEFEVTYGDEEDDA